jgi:hypothetical protein
MITRRHYLGSNKVSPIEEVEVVSFCKDELENNLDFHWNFNSKFGVVESFNRLDDLFMVLNFNCIEKYESKYGSVAI